MLRGSRSTPGQLRAIRELWPSMGLSVANGMLDFAAVFGRVAPTYLEIGFGTGQTLLAAAQAISREKFYWRGNA